MERGALRLIDEGIRLEDSGDANAALDRYDGAVRAMPSLARAHLSRGNALLTLGRTAEALTAYAAAIDRDPNYAAAHYNLGNASLRSGRHDDALAAYRKTLFLKPDFADAEVAMGCVLEEMGRPAEAINAYQRALVIRPQYAEAHGNLGNALRATGAGSEAVTAYRAALAINPHLVGVQRSLGGTLLGLAEPDAAAACFREVLKARPDDVEAHFGLGNALRELGGLDEAVASYELAIACNPGFAGVHYNLGNVQRQLGHFDASIASYRRSIELQPDFADAHHNLGNALTDAGLFEEAIVSQRQALELRPQYVEAWFGLANAQTGRGELAGAVESYGRALVIEPGRAECHHDLGTTLYKQGRITEATACFRRSLAIKPDFGDAWTGLLFCLSHDASQDAETLFAEHRRFGEQFEKSQIRAEHRNVRDPDRGLRVGFVSADFREHAVAVFCEPVLAELARSRSLTLHAYFNHTRGDSATDRLRHHFDDWTPVARLSDAAVAQRIEEDGIDILIDLSGHTAGNRLPVFARKPAPVQASWIGYLGTTGLRAMDYYLADERILPREQWGNRFTEKLVSLPAWAAFVPSADAPPVDALPALANGYVTFGSFNRLSKLGPAVIALWSRLLRAVPDSRILMGGMPPEGQYDSLIASFAREGIARERLQFHPRCSAQAYLALHHRVDIALDAFPYTGGNTSTHALSMGVPVLTLASTTPPSRQGAAIMQHAGLAEFVARDAADFERRGVYWTEHLDVLAQVRTELRERCFASPMGQPSVIASALEQALRTMWRRWCAGQQPESFVADAGK